MVKMNVYLLLVITLISFSCKKTDPGSQIVLKNNWEFRQVGKKEWYPASVPGTVHQDLLKQGFIKDPFFGLNEFDQQWIENEDWEYKTVFNISDEIFGHD